LLWKPLVAMKITCCYGKLIAAMEFTGWYT
jgi:hypothetical protein